MLLVGAAPTGASSPLAGVAWTGPLAPTVLPAAAQKSSLDEFGEEEEEGPDEPAAPDTIATESPDQDMPADQEGSADRDDAPGQPAEGPSRSPLDTPEDAEPAEPEEAEEEEEQDPFGPPSSPVTMPAEEEEEEEKQQQQPRETRQPGVEREPVCDRVLWNRAPGRKQWLNVMLYERYMGRTLSQVDRAVPHRLRLFSSAGENYQSVQGSRIERIEYYEERMGNKAAREVGVSFDELADPEHALDVSNPGWSEAAGRAQEILDRAIDEHDSAVQRRLRRGLGWDQLRQPLVQARLNLQLAEVDRLIENGTFQQAEAECDRLRSDVGRDEQLLAHIRGRVEKIVAIRAREALEKRDYATVRQLTEQFSTRYPGKLGGQVRDIRQELADRAAELAKEAEELKETSPRKAEELLREAAKIWPRLSRIDELTRQINEDYPVLRCAYSELPRKSNLSPMTARSPVERHAVSLVFESLVRWVDDPRIGAHFDCQLADGLPEPLVRGRQFTLLRTDWSDSSDTQPHICIGEDVRRTLDVLTNPACPGHSPAWSGLLAGAETSYDPYRVLLRLGIDHWQPMSLMDFKILPGNSFAGAGPDELKRQLQEFSRRPVGTGAYRLAGYAPSDDGTPTEVRFVANPHYREEGLPKIREIVFQHLEAADAEEKFKSGEVHLIYGVQPEIVSRLAQAGHAVQVLKPPTVTFLAPNYRRSALENEHVRLAIAQAIDREAILKQHFRPGGRDEDHAAITGPYPKFAADSRPCWAYNTAVAGFNPELAPAHAEEACKQLNRTSLQLDLIYPGGRPDVEQACRQIAETVRQRTAGDGRTCIELTPRKIDPGVFYDRVTGAHDFDLAYWSHTFEDSTYWLEPLLDEDEAARRPGGLNFMGYVPDEDLARLFSGVRKHKQFRQIQDLTHEVHEHVFSTAVVIPLWQLDVYVAVSRQLELEKERKSFDPFAPYSGVERWSIRWEPAP